MDSLKAAQTAGVVNAIKTPPKTNPEKIASTGMSSEFSARRPRDADREGSLVTSSKNTLPASFWGGLSLGFGCSSLIVSS
jgi:hypothetical protein